jgi:hypothetical protein
MAYRVLQTNKKTGVTYVYEAVAVWDKQKKQPRSNRVCVGKLDPETGEFIPSKRLKPEQAAVRDPSVSATTKVAGPALVLDKVVAELGLDRTLRKAFPDVWKEILAMAYFLAARGGPLSHCEGWCRSHLQPSERKLESQRVSEILSRLDLDSQKTFLREWGKRITERDYLYPRFSIRRFQPDWWVSSDSGCRDRRNMF